MKVLIVNTSERTGGAAVAAGRLMEALNNHGVKARMMVRDKHSDNIHVASIGPRWLMRWRFLWERFVIYCHLHFTRVHLFEIDIANTGIDITSTREFQEADVIHLHWINQGMLSLNDISKILRTGKPVVWTMHDIWPATAICHYSRGCRHYTSACHNCQLLPNHGSQKDLSAAVWKRKSDMLSRGDITFVACSRWLEGEAKKSALLKGHNITNIPNAIDTHIYHNINKVEARRSLGLPEEGRIILFVSQRVTDERKGISYLIEAVETMVKENPELKENTGIAILGSHTEQLSNELPLPVYPLGYVNDEQKIVNIYNAADVFVSPSLEDNLPNTIMEAMACGVPCVGFRVGGIPEMIDHQRNGYVAEPRNSSDLAKGIRWILDEADAKALSESALHKVVHNYSQSSVALRYTEVYQHAIAQNHFRL